MREVDDDSNGNGKTKACKSPFAIDYSPNIHFRRGRETRASRTGSQQHEGHEGTKIRRWVRLRSILLSSDLIVAATIVVFQRDQAAVRHVAK